MSRVSWSEATTKERSKTSFLLLLLYDFVYLLSLLSPPPLSQLKGLFMFGYMWEKEGLGTSINDNIDNIRIIESESGRENGMLCWGIWIEWIS